MEYLEAICELGPRPSGSEGMEKQRELLIRHFQKAGATVFRQAFRSRDGRNGDWCMENLIVSWHPERNDRVLLGAHYDNGRTRIEIVVTLGAYFLGPMMVRVALQF